MTPRSFIDDIAHVNSARFLGSKNNLRLAINAVMSLDTAVDVLFSALKAKNDSVTRRCESADAFKDEIAADNPEYDLVRRLARSLRMGGVGEPDIGIVQAKGAASSSTLHKLVANRSALNTRSVTIETNGEVFPADEIVLGTDMMLTSLVMRHSL